MIPSPIDEESAGTARTVLELSNKSFSRVSILEPWLQSGSHGSQLYESMAPGPSSLEPLPTYVLKVWSQTIDGNNNQSRNKLQQSAPLQIEMTLGKTKLRTYVRTTNCKLCQ